MQKNNDTSSATGSPLTDHIRSLLQDEINHQGQGKGQSLMADLDPSEQPLSERDLLIKVRGVPLQHLSAFARELAILLKAGMPIILALRNIGRRTTDQKLRKVIFDTGVMIENGQSFWEALGTYPRVFSNLFVSTVRAGELSGKLPQVLLRLADYAEREHLVRKRIGAALVYPLMVLVLAVIISIVLTAVVIPVFVRLLESFDTELPLITEWVVAFAKWLPQNWIFLITSIVILAIAFKLSLKTMPVRLLVDRIKLSLPVFGSINRKVAAARFARTFALLFHSGIPIIESLAVSRQAVGNEVALLTLQSAQDRIENGQTLEAAFHDVTVFPPMLIDMIIVGEQSGQLDEVLSQAAHVYDEEVDITMRTIGTLIEPALVLFMGILVLTIFAAFFVPYIRILSAAGA